MNRTTKGILASIPLVVGLAGPVAAALSEAADTGGSNGAEVSIDSLLNQYGGLLPGDHGMEAVSHEVPNSQKLSSYTNAASSMNTGYTNQGVDRTSANQPARAVDYIASGSTAGTSGSDLNAASVGAPAIGAITVAHAVQDTLVGAVAGSVTPTSSNEVSSNAVVATNAAPPPEPAPPVSTPIPPAAVLIGSGLTALATLRKRNQGTLAE